MVKITSSTSRAFAFLVILGAVRPPKPPAAPDRRMPRFPRRFFSTSLSHLPPSAASRDSLLHRRRLRRRPHDGDDRAKCPHISVTVVDISQPRIDAWNSDELPIYEPGLDEVVKACRGKNLFFTTDVEGAIAKCDMIFVSVNTPTKKTGLGKGKAADLTYWEAAARTIAAVSKTDKIIVEKSTVPVRTAAAIEMVLKRNCSDSTVQFNILSNPEFLAEGTAMTDLADPDRVLIGGKIEGQAGQDAVDALAEVYANWVPQERSPRQPLVRRAV